MNQNQSAPEQSSKTPSSGDKAFFTSLGRLQIFDSLQFHDFRWLWLGTFASFMAMNMQMITRGWLVLGMADDSPFALSLVMMSFALPMLFVSLIGGALADRIPRKTMIIYCQTGNAIMTLLLATLVFFNFIQFWHLLVIGAINGSLLAINVPSRQTIVSDLVPGDRLMNAISLSNSGMNLARVVGPAVAGWLILYLKTWGVFYLIGLFYLFSVLSMTMVRAGGIIPSQTPKSMKSDISEGLRYAAANPTILGLIVMQFVPALFGFSYFVLIPAWAREALDVRADGLGLLMMFMGIGSFAGSLILASIKNFPRRGALLVVCTACWGAALTLFSQTSTYGTALPALLVVGLLSAGSMSLNMTLMQTYAEPEVRGRVLSIGFMSFGVMPLSAVPFGALAERIGTPDSLGLSGLILMVFTVIFAVAYPRILKIN
ncbi:MAG: MFS transporter [Desulfobacterales bacterium]|nr:MFS transporter [Desulfobacterales bacterium]